MFLSRFEMFMNWMSDTNKRKQTMCSYLEEKKKCLRLGVDKALSLSSMIYSTSTGEYDHWTFEIVRCVLSKKATPTIESIHCKCNISIVSMNGWGPMSMGALFRYIDSSSAAYCFASTNPVESEKTFTITSEIAQSGDGYLCISISSHS